MMVYFAAVLPGVPEGAICCDEQMPHTTSAGDVPKRGQLGNRRTQLWLYICIITSHVLFGGNVDWAWV
jgi:hypothetical protein